MAKAITGAGIPASTESAEPQGVKIVISPLDSLGQLDPGIVDEVKEAMPAADESFVILNKGKTIYGIGKDDVGAMYAAYDIGEQFELMSPKPDARKIKDKALAPSIEIRAVNPFLHVTAINDPKSWFHDEEYWKTYLDELSVDRFNLIDIHAMYELVSTFFPNCYLYLTHSDDFPDIGVSKEEADRNLAMLNRIIDLALERGIRISLMSYHASWRMTSDDETEEPSDEDLQKYTADAVKTIIDRCPKLWMIGFRIGESGRSADFFDKSYMKGIKEASRDIYLFTRTWHTSREQVLAIPESYPNKTFLEIKYNGEQLGLPYLAMTYNRHHASPDYTWEYYSNWPRKYKIIWQIRANGTHRLFRWGDPTFVVRASEATKLAAGAGFSLESMTSYYPKTDYFYNPEKGFDYFKWDHQRNWFYFMLWGRLSYNPNEPREVWINRFAKHYGEKAADDVYEMMVQLSGIVPFIYSWRCIGVDHRSTAPEYETVGNLREFAANHPLDPHSISSIDEYVDNIFSKDELIDAKLNPFESADLIESYAEKALAAADRAAKNVAGDNKEFESLCVELKLLNELALYYSNKIRASVYFNIFEKKLTYPELKLAREYTLKAHDHWDKLSTLGEENFGQILDTLVMRKHLAKPTFTWREVQFQLQEDLDLLDAAEAEFNKRQESKGKVLFIGHSPKLIAQEGMPLEIVATVATTKDADVEITYKPDGSKDSRSIKMEYSGDDKSYSASIPAEDAKGDIQYFITAKAGGAQGRYPGKPIKSSSKDYDIMDYYYGNARDDSVNEKQRLKFESKKFVPVTFTTDNIPPEVMLEKAEVAKGGESVEIVISVRDASPVAKAVLHYKPMPTYYTWQKTDMEDIGDGKFSITMPLDSEGLLYYFNVADKFNNAVAYPDFLLETPYFIIESWDPANSPY